MARTTARRSGNGEVRRRSSRGRSGTPARDRQAPAEAVAEAAAREVARAAPSDPAQDKPAARRRRARKPPAAARPVDPATPADAPRRAADETAETASREVLSRAAAPEGLTVESDPPTVSPEGPTVESDRPTVSPEGPTVESDRPTVGPGSRPEGPAEEAGPADRRAFSPADAAGGAGPRRADAPDRAPVGRPGSASAGAAGEPVDLTQIPRQIQAEMAALVREQLTDAAETTRRLMACSSLPAAMSIQVEAAVRTVGRMVAHGQAMTALGRDMVRRLGGRRRGGR